MKYPCKLHDHSIHWNFHAVVFVLKFVLRFQTPSLAIISTDTAPKKEIDESSKKLISLKAEQPTTEGETTAEKGKKNHIEKVTSLGQNVKKLKEPGPTKEEIDEAVKKLLNAKGCTVSQKDTTKWLKRQIRKNPQWKNKN